MPLSCLEMAVSVAGWPTAEPFSLGNKVCLHFLSSSKFNLNLVSPTCHSLTNIPATDLSMCPIDLKIISAHKIKYKGSSNSRMSQGRGGKAGGGKETTKAISVLRYYHKAQFFVN